MVVSILLDSTVGSELVDPSRLVLGSLVEVVSADVDVLVSVTVDSVELLGSISEEVSVEVLVSALLDCTVISELVDISESVLDSLEVDIARLDVLSSPTSDSIVELVLDIVLSDIVDSLAVVVSVELESVVSLILTVELPLVVVSLISDSLIVVDVLVSTILDELMVLSAS